MRSCRYGTGLNTIKPGCRHFSLLPCKKKRRVFHAANIRLMRQRQKALSSNVSKDDKTLMGLQFFPRFFKTGFFIGVCPLQSRDFHFLLCLRLDIE